MSDQYDSPWKEILERYFADFLAFFFPEAHRDIDWTRGWESCDQELQKIVRDAELGKRLADKLMKVWRLSGEEQYVYAHVEIQGEREAEFGERMYLYNYRIYDRYRKPVVSLAILGDDSAGWRPDGFGWELWGCRVGLTFPAVKLLDYEPRWAELEASDSPFAVVVMAHLKTKATRGDHESRLRWKTRIVRGLYRGGFERQEVLDFLWFADWLLRLPEELEEQFEDEVERLETETRMRYVMSIERRAIKRGIEQGVQQGILEGEASLLRRQLKRRFTPLPDWVEERLEKASREELESWADRVIEAEALEEVFA